MSTVFERFSETVNDREILITEVVLAPVSLAVALMPLPFMRAVVIA